MLSSFNNNFYDFKNQIGNKNVSDINFKPFTSDKYYDHSDFLHFSVASKNYLLIEKIIQSGFDINGRDSCGRTPLIIASGIKNNVEIIKLLLGNDCEINKSDFHLKSPIHYCVENSCINNLKKLDENKLFLDSQDSYGKTPLVYAVENNNYKITEFLISKGGTPYNLDHEGHSILFHGILNDVDINILKLLADKGSILQNNIFSYKNILKKTAINKLQMKIILEELKGKSLSELQILSFITKNVDKLKYIIERNFEIKAVQDSLLSFAIIGSNNDLLEFYLQKGLDPEKKDCLGLSPVFWASMNTDNGESLRILINNKTDINRSINFKNIGKITPLMISLQIKNKVNIRLLLENNVKTDKKTIAKIQKLKDEKLNRLLDKIEKK